MNGVTMGGGRIVPGADVRDVITWRMDRRTAWSAWDSLKHDWLLTPGGQGNPARVTSARLPQDPDDIVWLGDLWVVHAPGDKRPLYFDWTYLPLFVTQRSAYLSTSAIEGAQRHLALDSMRVTAARSLDRGSRREPRSRWALLVEGGDSDLDTFELHSSWFALAYVGALAGWPEPPR